MYNMCLWKPLHTILVRWLYLKILLQWFSVFLFGGNSTEVRLLKSHSDSALFNHPCTHRGDRFWHGYSNETIRLNIHTTYRPTFGIGVSSGTEQKPWAPSVHIQFTVSLCLVLRVSRCTPDIVHLRTVASMSTAVELTECGNEPDPVMYLMQFVVTVSAVFVCSYIQMTTYYKKRESRNHMKNVALY